MASCNSCDIAPSARVHGGTLNHTRVNGESEIKGGVLNHCTMNGGFVEGGSLNLCTINGGIVRMGALNHCRMEGGVVEGGVLNHCVVLPGAVVSGGVRNHETIGSEVRFGHGAPPYSGNGAPRTSSGSTSSGNRTNSSATSSGWMGGRPPYAGGSRPQPTVTATATAGPSGRNTSSEASTSNGLNTGSDEHPPSHLIDHVISMDLIHEAVMTPSGHTYDKKIIERHIQEHGKCPVTREPLARTDLRPNRVLQQLIDDWKSRRR